MFMYVEDINSWYEAYYGIISMMLVLFRNGMVTVSISVVLLYSHPFLHYYSSFKSDARQRSPGEADFNDGCR